MNWWLAIRNVLYYGLLPLAFLARLILYILHLLATPFIYVTNLLSHALLLPWRIIARFEALWYFLAIAVLLGIFSGAIVHLILRTCTVLFDLDRKPTPKDIPAKGHNAASYRAARETKKRKEDEKQEKIAMRAKLLASQPLIQEVVREARRRPISGPTTSPISPNTSTSATRSGLFQQTILEHSDEEDDSAF